MNHLMKTKRFILASAITVCAIGFCPATQADDWNKKTAITLSEPLQVPNKLLDPGKYVLKLLDSPADRHIVQIFNEDETKLITTILAIPNYRLQPTGKSSLSFWETPAGQPHALRAWFYPGDTFGQEFAYPTEMSSQLATYNKSSLPTYSQSNDDLATTKVEQGEQPAQAQTRTDTPNEANRSIEPTPQPVEAPPSPAAADPVAQSQPSESATEPTATPVPTELPHTASHYPLVALR